MHDFSSLKAMFDDFAKKQILDDEPKGLYEPINYMMGLGGKKIRPVSMP